MSDFQFYPGPIARMVALAAERLEISPSIILGESRARGSARARQAVMYAGCQLGISTTRIGHALGRDHSSVIHGRRVIEQLLPSDPKMRELVRDLIANGRRVDGVIRDTHVSSLREALSEFEGGAADAERSGNAAAMIAAFGLRRIAGAIRWALIELGESVPPRAS